MVRQTELQAALSLLVLSRKFRVLRYNINLADVFANPLRKFDQPPPCDPEDRQSKRRIIVPETIISTDCCIDRMLITFLEMGCR